jgi:hypothetical protein
MQEVCVGAVGCSIGCLAAGRHSIGVRLARCRG